MDGGDVRDKSIFGAVSTGAASSDHIKGISSWVSCGAQLDTASTGMGDVGRDKRDCSC